MIDHSIIVSWTVTPVRGSMGRVCVEERVKNVKGWTIFGPMHADNVDPFVASRKLYHISLRERAARGWWPVGHELKGLNRSDPH